jgi:phage baseplate assembly protein W
MGYQVVPVNNIVTVTNNVGLGVAFSTGTHGLFSSIYTTPQQVKQNLKSLLLTRVGERLMQPTFGTNLLNIIFEPNISDLKEDITDLLTAPINYWIPSITIESIDIITNEDDPTMIHNLKITINYSVQNFSTSTITFKSSTDGTLSVE